MSEILSAIFALLWIVTFSAALSYAQAAIRKASALDRLVGALMSDEAGEVLDDKAQLFVLKAVAAVLEEEQ